MKDQLPSMPRFVMLFSGYKSRISKHDQYYSQKFGVPSLHVFGRQDEVISQGKVVTCETEFKAANSLSDVFI